MASRLLLVVRLSSERAPQAVRQDCSFAKKQRLPLWAMFFLLLALDRPIGRLADAVAVLEGIGTAWVLGLLLLLDQISF